MPHWLPRNRLPLLLLPRLVSGTSILHPEIPDLLASEDALLEDFLGMAGRHSLSLERSVPLLFLAARLVCLGLLDTVWRVFSVPCPISFGLPRCRRICRGTSPSTPWNGSLRTHTPAVFKS